MPPLKNSPMPDIIGSALKSARESRKLDRAELATKCCLSSKMILELEEGGTTSFYTFALKVSAAKRVGNFLNLAESDYLISHQINTALESDSDSSPDLDASKSSSADRLEADGAPVVPSPTLEEAIVAPVAPVAPGITERLEWQELLTEKVGGNISAPSNKLGFARPVRTILIIASMTLLGGLAYSVNEKYDIANQLIALVNPSPPPPVVVLETPPAQEPVLESKTVVANEASVVPESNQPLCPYKQDGSITSYQSPNPSKLGDVVNLKTLVKQTICVIDGVGKQTVMSLEANTAHAFKGSAPFVLLGQDLDNVEMFFQGWRVRPTGTGAKQIKLVEVSL